MSAVLASFRDLEPAQGDFLADVLAGLSLTPKTLPCKYFYDEAGSLLFEQICDLPEYYLTRAELALLQCTAADIASHLGTAAQLVEFGSGAITKVRMLLDAMDNPSSYVAVDISRDHLIASAERLAQDYPGLPVHAVCADYTRRFEAPAAGGALRARRVGFFPGSTIGNFEPPEALVFLRNAARMVGAWGCMLIGTDLRKDPQTLIAAYDDAAGVTAAFNKNLLVRINRELEADFDLDAFAHRAVWNEGAGRIEMHLASRAAQEVQIAGHRFSFRRGESIHTENSHKYRVRDFQALARRAGFSAEAVWFDPEGLFALHLLRRRS